MSGLYEGLQAGEGRLCYAWRITRKDGQVFAMTDHDRDLQFDGQIFRAGAAVTPTLFSRSAGLALDGGEISGAVQWDGLNDEDLSAGRFHGAKVEQWRLDWADPAQPHLILCGQLGALRLEGARWYGEVMGLTEGLSRPIGRSYQRLCGAVLGDKGCKFALNTAGFTFNTLLSEVRSTQEIALIIPDYVAPRWFERGEILITSGVATGVTARVKADRIDGALRRFTLWTPLGILPHVDDGVRVSAGCDRRLETCRGKFGNVLNFQGFPTLPLSGSAL